jgi:Tfp pilus assembly protein PilV
MIETWLMGAMFFAIVLLAIMVMVRGVRHSKQARQQDDALRRLHSDVHALCAGAINLGNYMNSLEQRLRRMTERQDQLELRDPVQQTYAHAIRMVQQGADVNDLVKQCGLAQGEAELLLRVHRVQRYQAASA